jgi:NAD kinase
MAQHDKIVIVTRRTALEDLLERFHTKTQARFYIEHMGGSFEEYEAAHDVYEAAKQTLKNSLPKGVRSQWIDRSFVPTFLFGPSDLVVTLGQDGLVVNVAKYLADQPLLAFNPDPSRIDGVLLPFQLANAADALHKGIADQLPISTVTMARVTLNDGQTLHAVNDLFIGPRSHTSARYTIRYNGREELQSSSGIIVSTGAGSTGWLRAVLAGAAGTVAHQLKGTACAKQAAHSREDYRFDWELEELRFVVREPFITRVTGADLVAGTVKNGHSLELVSHMPTGGVIFSDGIEQDYLKFNSGATARIMVADRKLRLAKPMHFSKT